MDAFHTKRRKNIFLLLKRLLSILAATFLTLLSSSHTYAVAHQRTIQDQCYACHQAMGDKPGSLYGRDIHHKIGITCAGCHGGDATAEDPEIAMSKKAGFVGVPTGNAISEMCARCHDNDEFMKSYNPLLPAGQYAQLKGSVHGRASTVANEMVAQCTSCHGVHEIAKVTTPASPVYPTNVVRTCARCHSDPTYMKKYNPALRVDQFELYKTSVHGRRNMEGDPKVAECASCHGSHDILPAKDPRSHVYPINIPETCAKCHSNEKYMKPYHLPTNQYEEYVSSVHGVALLKKHDTGAPACNSCHGNHGAVPPGVQSVSNVCGVCHTLNAQLFEGSPHKKAFDQRKLPECEVCHGNHGVQHPTDAMLGVGEGSVCSRCHTLGDTSSGYQVAKVMRLMIDSLTNRQGLAERLLKEAEQKGMEVSEAFYNLRGARQSLMEARTAVHAFDLATFKDPLDKGMKIANQAVLDGESAIHEYYFRRWGLGISTLIITVLAFGLFLRIRQADREWREKQRRM